METLSGIVCFTHDAELSQLKLNISLIQCIMFSTTAKRHCKERSNEAIQKNN
jgi:hypothetical protein